MTLEYRLAPATELGALQRRVARKCRSRMRRRRATRPSRGGRRFHEGVTPFTKISRASLQLPLTSQSKCGGRELNPHPLRDRLLRPACLPVPPPPRIEATQYSEAALTVSNAPPWRWCLNLTGPATAPTPRQSSAWGCHGVHQSRPPSLTLPPTERLAARKCRSAPAIRPGWRGDPGSVSPVQMKTLPVALLRGGRVGGAWYNHRRPCASG